MKCYYFNSYLDFNSNFLISILCFVFFLFIYFIVNYLTNICSLILFECVSNFNYFYPTSNSHLHIYYRLNFNIKFFFCCLVVISVILMHSHLVKLHPNLFNLLKYCIMIYFDFSQFKKL